MPATGLRVGRIADFKTCCMVRPRRASCIGSVNNGASPDRWRVDHPNTMTQLGNHVRGSSILRYYHCFDALRVCVELSTPE